MPGCTINGVLDESEFSQPLPWVGLYIMAGNIACTLAMALDTFFNFHGRKFWFPTKYFSLNSSTLTFLAIATKFSVDLNTSMPRKQDQLAKLSSTALICTSIANFMPSLGNMQDSDIISNVIALAIFVITVVVNVGMQMGTGVIYVFLPEHALILSLMLVLLVILCSSALMVTPAKQELDKRYNLVFSLPDFDYDKILEKVPTGAEPGSIIAELKKSVKSRWLMAQTGSPQYVVGRSVTCHASGALCLVIPVVSMEASVRALIMDGTAVSFCGGTCDYEWSSTLVFSSQAIAVVVSTIAPASRFFFSVWLNRHTAETEWYGSHWLNKLDDWSHAPLTSKIRSRRIKKIATKMWNCIISVFTTFQSGVVVKICKLLRMASILPVRCCCPDSDRDPIGIVLSLGDESKDMASLMGRSGRKYVERWMEMGRKKKPTNLVEFISKYSNVKEGFKGVGWFDSDKVPYISPAWLGEGIKELPNCWALPAVTLTAIAVAIPNIEPSLIDSLLDSVSEGLTYVRLVEKNLDVGSLVTRHEADQVWQGIDLYGRWFRVDLNKLVLEGKSAKEIIKYLGDTGETWARSSSFLFAFQKMIARNQDVFTMTNCMYRVCRTILKDFDDNFGSLERLEEGLFEWLRMTIADIMGACLTNLPRALCMERNYIGDIEVREKIIRRSALLLEGAEEILKIVGAPGPDLYDGAQYYLESWRKKRQKHPLSLTSTSSSNPSDNVVTPDALSLSIE